MQLRLRSPQVGEGAPGPANSRLLEAPGGRPPLRTLDEWFDVSTMVDVLKRSQSTTSDRPAVAFAAIARLRRSRSSGGPPGRP